MNTVYVSVQFVDPPLLKDGDCVQQGLWAVLKPHLLLEYDKTEVLLQYFMHEKPSDWSYVVATEQHRPDIDEFCNAPRKKVVPVPLPPLTAIEWRTSSGSGLRFTADSDDAPEADGGGSGWRQFSFVNNLDVHKGLDDREKCVDAIVHLSAQERVRVIDWMVRLADWMAIGRDQVRSESRSIYVKNQLCGSASPLPAVDNVINAVDKQLMDLLVPGIGDSSLLLKGSDRTTVACELMRRLGLRCDATDQPDGEERERLAENWKGQKDLQAIYLFFLRRTPIAPIRKCIAELLQPGEDCLAKVRQIEDLLTGWPPPPLFKYDLSPRGQCEWACLDAKEDHNTYLEKVWRSWRERIGAAEGRRDEIWQLIDELAWFMSAGERLFWPDARSDDGTQTDNDRLLRLGCENRPEDRLTNAQQDGCDTSRWSWTSSFSLLGLTQRVFSEGSWQQAVSMAVIPLELRWQRPTLDSLTIGDSANLLDTGNARHELNQQLYQYAEESLRLGRSRPSGMQSAMLADPGKAGTVLWRPAFQTLNKWAFHVNGEKEKLTCHAVPPAFLDLLESRSQLCTPSESGDKDRFDQLTAQRFLLRRGDISLPGNDVAPAGLTFGMLVGVTLRVLMKESGTTHRLPNNGCFENMGGRCVCEIKLTSRDGEGQPYCELDMTELKKALFGSFDVNSSRKVYLTNKQQPGSAAQPIQHEDLVCVHDPVTDTDAIWWLGKLEVIKPFLTQDPQGAGVEVVDSSAALLWQLPDTAEAFNQLIVNDESKVGRGDGVVLAPTRFLDLAFGRSVDTQHFAMTVKLVSPLDGLARVYWRQAQSAQKGWLWLHQGDTVLRLTETAHMRPLHPNAEAARTCPALVAAPTKPDTQPSVALNFEFLERNVPDGEVERGSLMAESRRYSLWCNAGKTHALSVGLDQQYGFRNHSMVSEQLVLPLTSTIVHPADVRWKPGPTLRAPTRAKGTDARTDRLKALDRFADFPLLAWRLERRPVDRRFEVIVELDELALLSAFTSLKDVVSDEKDRAVMDMPNLRRLYEAFHELIAEGGDARAKATLHVEKWSYRSDSHGRQEGAASRSMSARLVRAPSNAVAVKLADEFKNKLGDLVNACRGNRLGEFISALRAYCQPIAVHLLSAGSSQRSWIPCFRQICSESTEIGADVLRVGWAVERSPGTLHPTGADLIIDTEHTRLLPRQLRDNSESGCGLPEWMTERTDDLPSKRPKKVGDAMTEQAATNAADRARRYLGSDGGESEVRRSFRWLARRHETSCALSVDGTEDSATDAWERERAAQIVGGSETNCVVIRKRPPPGATALPSCLRDIGGASAWFFTVPLAFLPLPAHPQFKDQRSTQEFFVFLLRVLNELADGGGSTLSRLMLMNERKNGQTTPEAQDLLPLTKAITRSRQLREQIASALSDHYLAIVEDDEEDGRELRNWQGRKPGAGVPLCGAAADAGAPADGEQNAAEERDLLGHVRRLREAALGPRTADVLATVANRSVVRERVRQTLLRDLSGYWVNKAWALHLFDPMAPATKRLANVQIRKLRSLSSEVKVKDPVLALSAAEIRLGAMTGPEEKTGADDLRDAVVVLQRSKYDPHARPMTTRALTDVVDALTQATAKAPLMDTDAFSWNDLLPIPLNDENFPAIVEGLDDDGYDNDFHVHAYGTRAQSYDDLMTAISVERIEGEACRFVPQCRNPLEQPRAQEPRAVELVPVHHNPEWRSWAREPGSDAWRIRRAYYLLPSRRSPNAPVWVAATQEATTKSSSIVAPRLLPTFGEPGPSKSALFPDQLAPADFHQYVEEGALTQAWVTAEVTVDADLRPRLDAYVWFAHFGFESDEKGGISNDRLEVEVRTLGPGGDSLTSDAAPEGRKQVLDHFQLGRWYQFFRATQAKPGAQASPEPIVPDTLIDELSKLLARSDEKNRTSLLASVATTASDSGGTDDVLCKSGCTTFILERRDGQLHARAESRPKLPDPVLVGAGLYKVVSKDGERVVSKDGERTRFMLRIALLGSVFESYQVRMRQRRNVRDTDFDNDEDINPAFEMNASSAWIRPGQVYARWRGALSATLPPTVSQPTPSVVAGDVGKFPPTNEGHDIHGPSYAAWRDGMVPFCSTGASWSDLAGQTQAYAGLKQMIAATKREVRVFHYEVMSDYEDLTWPKQQSWDDSVQVPNDPVVPETRATASLRQVGRGTWSETDETWAGRLFALEASKDPARRRAVSIEWRINDLPLLRVDGLPIIWA
ncbi:MAG: hypothetical protein IPG63_07625 [Xanthomonadales bacterium]|nr:hypothetical protein [Xanthomonadales bacterium]MBK7146883.1 hypothetical protein [Xanthomonadales bacterium]